MTWKIRHQGSPQLVEGLTLPQVVEGLQDGQWEPTDEVMGPNEGQWVALENHPQLAEVAADYEPPPPPSHEDETRLDMNPLIDVALVLLIFFILTTTYETMRKVLEMPSMSSDQVEGKLTEVAPEVVKDLMIVVEARQEDGKPIVRVEGKEVALPELETALKGYVRQRKTELLIDAAGVEWGTVVAIQDAARGAGIQKAHYLVKK